MKPSECIGCNSYRPERQFCFAILNNTEIEDIGSCACATCLIKMMCNKPCDAFGKSRRPE